MERLRLPPAIRFSVLSTVVATFAAPWPGNGRAATQRQTTSPTPTALADIVEAFLAVANSGVWDLEGEYKAKNRAYYKVRGYFAYVASTSKSVDSGDAAVLAMYLEPMAGGSPEWLSARLACEQAGQIGSVRCLAVDGASELLDLNFLFRVRPRRGEKCEVEVVEPEDKAAAKRWESRTRARGRLTLVPPR